MDKHISIKADKVSGFEASVFGASHIAYVVMMVNVRHRFVFPFYGLSYDLENLQGKEWIDEKAWEAEVDRLLNMLRKEGFGYFDRFEKDILKENRKLFKYVPKVVSQIPKLSDYDLIQLYTEAMEKYGSYYALGGLTFLFESIISDRIDASLRKKYKAKTTEIISTLLKSNYESFIIRQGKLLQKISRAKGDKQKNLVEKYLKEHFYMKSNYAGSEVLTSKFVIKMAMATKEEKKGIQPSSTLNIKLNKEEKIMVELLRRAEMIRDKRKEVNIMGEFMLFRFLDEAAKRSKIDLKLLKRAQWFEYPEILYSPGDMERKLQARKSAAFSFIDNNITYYDYDPFVSRNAGQSLKGTPASKGKVKGKVRIVLGSKEFDSFQTGEILVAEMTRPEFLPLMKKASAIITDEGGLTCHAAIVSREIGIPCIVGVRGATESLRNGDSIEVDADTGKIIRN